MLKRLVLRVIRPINGALTFVLTADPDERDGLTDVMRFPIGPELEARVGWIDRVGERGPTCSVFWTRQELLRIDLFDQWPHLHYGLAQQKLAGAASARIFIRETSLAGRIERAVYEVRHNLRWCLQTHPSRRVRGIRLREEDLEQAALKLREQISDLARRHRV